MGNISARELAELSLFKEQEPKVLEYLSKTVEEKVYTPGTEIFAEGSTGDALYIILSGEVLITKIINKVTGETKPLSLLGKGDFFGEMSLLDDKPRFASAVAKTETKLLRLSRSGFQNLLSSDPKIAARQLFALINQLTQRLRHTSEELTTLFETGRIIGRVRNLPEMCQLILRQLREVVPQSEAGFIVLENEYTGEYDIYAAEGIPQELLGPVLPQDPLLNYFLQQRREYLLLTDWTDGESVIPREQFYSARSLLASPLVHENKFFGLLVLFNQHEKNVFDKEDLQLISAVSSQVTAAIRLARYREEEDARERLRRAREKVL